MPSYPLRTDKGPASPISSNVAFAASFALPASRANSPGTSPLTGHPSNGLPYLKGDRRGQRDPSRYNSGHKWDNAWDSGSDDETPVAPSAGRSKTPAAVPVPIANPLQKDKPSSDNVAMGSQPQRTTDDNTNGSSNGLRLNTGSTTSTHNAPLALLTRSFSYTHISPPSPSSYDNKSNGYLPPKAEWQVLETGEIVEAEQTYSTVDNSKNAMYGFGNDWIPEKKKPEVKSPSVSAASLVSSAFGFGSSRWKGKEKEKPSVENVFNPVVEEKQPPKEKVGKEALKEDVDEILKDPLYTLKMSSESSASPIPPGSNSETSSERPLAGSNNRVDDVRGPKPIGRTRSGSIRTERKRERFAKVLRGRGAERGGGVDPTELRKMAWAGIPEELRPIAWQMLLNYLPLPAQPRLATLQRKRKEYAHLVTQAFARGMTTADAQIWHQIEIDVPRTRPGVPLWACEVTQRSLERILYVWAIRHPASGYVQGINDLVTPFFEVFLSAYVDCDPELFDTTQLPANILAAIEADSFWCLSKLLDGIQDNYISAQPGIHRQVRRMAELVKRIDCPLATHMDEQGVEYMQFAFRWMNCLLMREISVKCTIRMWDTYLAEGTDAFSQFHLYVCSAFLVKWSEKLQRMDFQEIIMFLQRLPTESWSDFDVELLLSEAFVLKSVWQGAENHFNGNIEGPLGGGMGGR